MTGNNPHERYFSAGFCVLVILATFVLIYVVGDLNGRQSERRQQESSIHIETAKEQARRTCVGMNLITTIKCVSEIVQASEDHKLDEQDLVAQQRAAWGTMLGSGVAFLALLATIIGLYYVRETLRATLRAVEDTSEATKAMHAANEIAKEASRPWLKMFTPQDVSLLSVTVETIGKRWGGVHFKVEIKNFGNGPAIGPHLDAVFFDKRNGFNRIEVQKRLRHFVETTGFGAAPVYPGDTALLGENTIFIRNIQENPILEINDMGLMIGVWYGEVGSERWFHITSVYFLKIDENRNISDSHRIPITVENVQYMTEAT
ncbi:hypothetical protein F9288_02865 [Sphingomonas sp. CL5.1]|uniref:hypothetical protein n=1 Tax=Sphingomonas sp. CL5.1 TaxID=2653203 RepID=UPI001583793A|nr:hypothetical protein [Sphingomonas sp. CL5.1]QKR98704.1 hypothetical protein F9288_02865 [Sphingomonas sp. CL5.1]